MPKHRTKADMTAIREAIIDFATTEGPVTVRQVFYNLVTKGLVEKTELEYSRTVSRVLTVMREDGDLDWDLVFDATRFVREPQAYASLADMLTDAARMYRRQAWLTQPTAIEVWCEKDALAGILQQVTYPLGIPLFVNKGYGSATYVHDAALRIDERWDERQQRTTILYFGDYDPSGMHMSENLVERLTKYSDWTPPTFDLVRVALNASDIATYGLPGRPTKQTDSRAKKFGTQDSVELDALTPTQLRSLAQSAIDSRMDRDAYDVVLVAEQSEREILEAIAAAKRGES